MDKVSIIIPIFNMEKYLNKCIESVSRQTYKNIEIILINDGSTDSSEQIAIEWSKKDSRIIYVYQENKGSGIARNNGLSKATGKYIVFVDPDDWIEEDAIEQFVSQMEINNADLIIACAYNEYFDKDGKILETKKDSFLNEYINDIKKIQNRYVPLFLENAITAPWNKMYKLDIIKQNNIEFPNLKRSQDIVFNYKYYDCIKSLQIYDKRLYHYRIESETYGKKINVEYYKTVCKIYEDINKLLEKWNVELEQKENTEFIKYFYNLIIWQISIGKSSKVMYDIVNNETVHSIILKSKPKGLKQSILRTLLLWKQDKIINFLTYIIKRDR